MGFHTLLVHVLHFLMQVMVDTVAGIRHGQALELNWHGTLLYIKYDYSRICKLTMSLYLQVPLPLSSMRLQTNCSRCQAPSM